MTWAIRWCPGRRRALVWPGGVALVDATVSLEAIERVWAATQSPPSLGAFLEQVAGQLQVPLTGLPAFAVALTEGAEVQLAVRGELRITVGGTGETLDGAQTSTWIERRIPPPIGLRIEALDLERDSAEDVWLPVNSGIVLASAIQLGSATAASASHPVEVPRPVRTASWGRARTSAGAKPGVPSSTPVSAPEPAAAPGPAPYDWLVDESIVISVEAAAVREDAVAEEPGTAGSGAAEPGSPPSLPVGRADSDQHDGETVMDPAGEELLVSPHRPEVLGPTVLAAFCGNGHPNPTRRTVCYRCGGAVAGQARRVPRPCLGRIRCSVGEVIDLVGPVVAGRSPSATAQAGGGMARLLALPYDYISGRHLELRLEDWTVLAVDLQSRNGTLLRRVGEAPVRLPHRPVPLLDGDTLDFGHGVVAVLEGLP